MTIAGHSFVRRARDDLAPLYRDMGRKHINRVDISISDPIRASKYVREMEIDHNISHVYTVSDRVVTLDDLTQRREEILSTFPRIIDLDITSNDIARFPNVDARPRPQSFRAMQIPD